MNHKKRILVIGLYLSVLLLFSLLSIKYGKYAADFLSSVSARYDEAVLTPQSVTKAMKDDAGNHKESLEPTLWNRLKKEKVENNLTGLQTETNVIEVYGDMSQVIPFFLLSGSMVQEEDAYGCVLDSVTAYHLFGTIRAVGNHMVWKRKIYVVRGVIKAKDTVMMIQIRDTGHKFSNLEAVFGGRGKKRIDNQGQLLKNFLQNNGMEEPAAVIDGNLITYLLFLVYHLALWILAGEIIYFILKSTFLFQNQKFLCFLLGLTALISVPLFIWLTDFHIYLPSQMIPGKWSDFDFYAAKYKEWKNAVLDMNNNHLLPKDKLRMYYSSRCILYGILSVLMLIPVQIGMVRFFKRMRKYERYKDISA